LSLEDLAAKILIDTDAGIDDSLAVLAVCTLAGDRLQAVTCTAGNTSLEGVVNNVLLTLDQAGSDVPVYAGSIRPLMGIPADAGPIMGPDGLGGATQFLPPASHSKAEGAAALTILEQSRGAAPVTLLALGPLTNLALALRLDEDLPSRVDELVIMGGAVNAQGNATSAAEFNFFCDPEAAYSVLRAGFKRITLVPWETCIRAAIPWEAYEQLCTRETRRAAFFRMITSSLAGILRDQYHLPGLILPDMAAALVMLDPSSALEICEAAVEVVIQHGAGRGISAVDWRGLGELAPNARIVLAVDQSKLYNMLDTILSIDS
jgi:purine nucleosidase